MQKHPLNTFGSFAASADDTITLLDGTKIPMIYVSFIPSTYQFIWNKSGQKVDVTYNMTQAQKRLFPGFDPVVWNDKLYVINAQKQGKTVPTQPLETSVATLFKQNVVKDIAAKANLGIGSLGATLGLVIGGYIIFQIVTHKK